MSDRVQTALNIVSLPEEMPVNEAIDLDREATELGMPRGALIVNGLAPHLFPEGAKALDRVKPKTTLTRTILDRARSTVALRAEQDALLGRLDGTVPLRRLALPLLVCPRVGPDEIETLADHLSAF